jgi:protein involved in ribonucleotide reduction
MLLLNDVGKKYVLLYDTMTLNTEKFCNKVKKKFGDKIAVHNIKEILDNFGFFKMTECKKGDIEIHLVTYTIMQGKVPKTTMGLLDKYKFYKIIKTISSTGQKNWGSDLFAKAVDVVNEKYPNIEKGLKIELQGTVKDVNAMGKLILGDDI